MKALRSSQRGWGQTSAGALLILIGLAWPVFAQEAPTTIDPDAGCTIGGCHGEQSGLKHMHPPAEEDCQNCHSAMGNLHRFETEAAPDVCLMCHEGPNEEHNIHPPAMDDCTGCHNPHGSNTAGMLEADSMEELCFACHDGEMIEGQTVHPAVMDGGCTSCHNPHSSPNDKLLLESGTAVCGTCHSDITDALEGDGDVHPPAAEDCLNCHNPHASEHPSLLLNNVRSTCATCHDDVLEQIKSAKVYHRPALTPESCVSCHNPHASAHSPLLKEETQKLCRGCHNSQLVREGSKLDNLDQRLHRATTFHPPVEEDCANCHLPHGSDNAKLLHAAYPDKFYVPFSESTYELCLMCHDGEVFTNPAYSETHFRDGDKNLHYVHVRDKERPRSCNACHNVHATQNPHLIQTMVPYGNWRMPLQYEATTTGGSCTPGCHNKLSYQHTAPENVETEVVE